MACCGKLSQIVMGWALLISDRQCKDTAWRIRQCRECEHQTWMSAKEYAAWLIAHGIKVLANLEQLEKLEPLPKYEQDQKRKSLFCRLCKCYVPAKAGLEKMTCLKGHWERPNDKE